MMTKKQRAAFDAMTPPERRDWIVQGAPDAVLMADLQANEFYRPMLNGVIVSETKHETYDAARAEAAEFLAHWLRNPDEVMGVIVPPPAPKKEPLRL